MAAHCTGETHQMAIDFTALDGAGRPWTLTDHLGSAVVITFHRGDF